MRARRFILIAAVVLLGGCARSVMPTGYLEQPGASRSGMNSAWTAPGVRLGSFRNILVKEFSIEKTVPDHEKVNKKVKSALLQRELVSALKRRGKNATDDVADLPANEPRLVLEGNMAQINPGSRALRYWIGFGAGRSLVEVEGRAIAEENDEATKCAEFAIGKSKWIGVWGGDSNKFIDDGMRDISRRVADFISRN
ncbi:DUF4410 domain-containing protein [Candidatus Sumerlaeota bacterium]|nr:DUF4410 domain-containing protein [Candidatus Sumerlaeota bacterium]